MARVGKRRTVGIWMATIRVRVSSVGGMEGSCLKFAYVVLFS